MGRCDRQQLSGAANRRPQPALMWHRVGGSHHVAGLLLPCLQRRATRTCPPTTAPSRTTTAGRRPAGAGHGPKGVRCWWERYQWPGGNQPCCWGATVLRGTRLRPGSHTQQVTTRRQGKKRRRPLPAAGCAPPPPPPAAAAATGLPVLPRLGSFSETDWRAACCARPAAWYQAAVQVHARPPNRHPGPAARRCGRRGRH